MAKSPTKTEDAEIVVPRLEMSELNVRLLGVTPLYINRMSAKAKRQLLIGGRKKTTAEKALIKHDPITEFRDAMNIDWDWHEHSHIRFPSMAIKSAMGTAALVTPGIYKTDVQRLVFMPDEWVPIFGVPRLRMSVMRSADARRTPDIRTRPWFETWGTEVRIRYSQLALSQESIISILSNAGLVAGVGDERQEKGKGSAGSFEPVSELPEILLDADAQRAAIEEPLPADQETEGLMNEIIAEQRRRAA